MPRDSGFTLLEVMVAFIIAALALAALVRGVGSGLEEVRVAGHYQEALSRARSRLAAVTVAPQAGVSEGDDGGGFRWRSTVAALASTGRPPPEAKDPPRRAVLYGVTVMVSWTSDGGRREVVLTSRAVGEAPPAPP